MHPLGIDFISFDFAHETPGSRSACHPMNGLIKRLIRKSLCRDCSARLKATKIRFLRAFKNNLSTTRSRRVSDRRKANKVYHFNRPNLKVAANCLYFGKCYFNMQEHA
jgi:hypothetical protein